MNKLEKIALLESMLEISAGSINEQSVLVDIPEWDSMAAISLIALMDENFKKELTGPQVKKFKTVQDILDFMG